MPTPSQLARRKPPLHLVYLAANIPLVIAVFAFPAYHTFLWGSMGLGATGAVAAGALRSRPRRLGAWLLVAGALGAFITGDILYDVLTKILHEVNPYPSIADVFYLATYPLLALGLLIMVRARRREPDSGALVDALTVTSGAFLLSWIYLIQPYVHAHNMTLMMRATSIAYPLGDILILCMLARLFSGGGLRNGSLVLMGAGGIGLLAADVVYGWIQLNGVWSVGGPTDLGWVAFYLFWGAAALHPNMGGLTEQQPARPRQLSVVALVTLSAVTLVAPLLLLWRVTVLGKTSDAAPIAAVSALLFILVVARLSGLARNQGQQTRREAAIRRFGERLVAATGSDEVFAEGIIAVRAALGRRVQAVLVTESGPAGDLVAAADRPGFVGALVALDLAGAAAGPVVVEVTGADPALLPSSMSWTAMSWTAFPLPTGGVQRRLLVASTGSLPMEITGVLEAVASHLALAVDRVELATALHKRRSEARFRALVQHASDVILVVAEGGEMKAETPSLTEVLGYTQADLEGMRFWDLVPPEEAPLALAAIGALIEGTRREAFRTEWRIRHADGRWIPMEVLGTDLTEEAHVAGVVLTLRDVTERKQLEEELRYQAFHDSLTKLANRALFFDRVETALRQRPDRNRAVSVLLLDLDDFKLINDTFGHGAGDELLVQFGRRLLGCLRKGDTAARLGGDEFAICIQSEAGDLGPSLLAARIEQEMRVPFAVGGVELPARVSIGVATATLDAAGADEMLREADLALYAAKNAGKATFRFFQPELHEAVVARMEQRSSLEKAVAGDQLACWYQPIVRLSDGVTVAVEALVRWNHPQRGIVAPAEFIPVAEDAGLMGTLGDWVLNRACADLARWRAEIPEAADLHISVNVSAQQLHSAGFAEIVERCLSKHRLPPSSLTLEITESVLVLDHRELAENLSGLRELGVALALDDFGTGYSSLSYLHRLPVSSLKVDRSFVLGMDREDGVKLVDAIASIGRSLGLSLVAEGIEREDQARRLRSLGCQLGQGYLFGRPMPAEALARSLGQLVQTGEPQPRGLWLQPVAVGRGVPAPSLPPATRPEGSRRLERKESR
ncbi:MAG TPA: EAL domain-containing protein [Actinomycetota bacterium]|nr:EAL domain-containing protein [Actinomycetota bacterium]